MKNLPSITLMPVLDIPEIKAGDSIGEIIETAIKKNSIKLEKNDVVVIAQKIVSKAENRVVDLNRVKPTNFALSLSKEISKDPRLVEVILNETKKIIKMDQRVSGKGRLIVETRGGLVLANAGVDVSNVSPSGDIVTLLPEDADRSARLIRTRLKRISPKGAAVIITDTVGRPWREGLVDIAIGCAGIKPLTDYRGKKDSKGLELTATEMATADQIACAGGLLMDKTGSIPVVIVRGCKYIVRGGGAKRLIRNPLEDLFR